MLRPRRHALASVSLAVIVTLATLVVSLGMAVIAERQMVERRLRRDVIMLESELAAAIDAENWFLLRKIGKSFYFGEFTALSITVGAQVIHVDRHPFVPSQCHFRIVEPIQRYGRGIGQIQACLSPLSLLQNALINPWFIPASISTAAAAAFATMLPLARYRRSLRQSVHILKKWAIGKDKQLPDLQNEDPIVEEVIDLVKGGLERELAAERELLSLASMRDLARHSAQVAHDIRSPLSVLSMALRLEGAASEESRTAMRSAIFRIQDIANQLLSHRRNQSSGLAESAGTQMLPTLLSSLLEVIVSEKRTQYRALLSIKIEADVDAAAYGQFVMISAGELKRVLSNLIDNAVEAIERSGNVTVGLRAAGADARLTIQDDGKGMAPEVLRCLGQEGFTHEKEDGNGLGVHHASGAITSWGGSLAFESQDGAGTIATIALPCVLPPAWFLSKIELDGVTTVVILDDDISIHNLWAERLSRYAPGTLHIVDMSSPVELLDYCEASETLAITLFLVDHELRGHVTTGLDLIADLNIAARSVLVTSRFEEGAVIARCLDLGVKLLPKPAAAYIPIGTVVGLEGTRPMIDAVLIDDDPLVRWMWSEAATASGVTIEIFADFDAFQRQATLLPRNLPIYIDCDLGHGPAGHHLAKTIFQQGFNTIYLTTAHPKGEFEDTPWLKGILGKDPPF